MAVEAVLAGLRTDCAVSGNQLGIHREILFWLNLDIITFSCLLSDFRCFNGQILLADINDELDIKIDQSFDSKSA